MDDAQLLSDARRRLPAARQALQAATGDMPCSGSSQGGSGTSDRTGRIAITVIEGADAAWADTTQLDQLERTIIRRCQTGQPITRELGRLIDIIDRWAPTAKQRTAIDRNLRDAAADLLNKTEDHGNCLSCKRVPGVYGTPHRKGLCKTCDRWLQRVLAHYNVQLELPPRALVELGQAHGKITDRDIHTVMHGQPRRDA